MASTERRGGGTEGKKQTNGQKGTTPVPALSGGSVGQEKKKNARTKLPSPITQGTLQTLTLKIPKHLKEPKEKDGDLNTQKTPETTQGENSNPKTQKVPKIIQGEEPRIPENCRARRRRESQLTTAAPLE